MAEGKNGVLVYADWKKKFDKLSDEEAGRLIKHFFSYINDEHPVAPDRIVEIAFMDIESTLKRDLKKWEGTVEKNSTSGRVGNLKRWNPDLYEKYLSKELSINECEAIAENRKRDKIVATAIKTVAPDREPSQRVAKIADNDNDNDNDINIYTAKEVLKKVLLEDRWWMSIRNRLRSFYQSDEHLLKLLDDFCEQKQHEPFNDDRHRYHSFVRFVEFKHIEANKGIFKKEETTIVPKSKTARD